MVKKIKSAKNENITMGNGPSNNNDDVLTCIACGLNTLIYGENSNDPKSLMNYNQTNIFSIISNINNNVNDIVKKINIEPKNENNDTTIINEINSNISKIKTSFVDIFNFDRLINSIEDTNIKIIDINSNIKNILSSLRNDKRNNDNTNNITTIDLNIRSNNFDSLTNFFKTVNSKTIDTEKLTQTFDILSILIKKLPTINKNLTIPKIDISWMFTLIDNVNKMNSVSIVSAKYKLFVFRKFLLNDLIKFGNSITAKLISYNEKNKKPIQLSFISNIFSIIDNISKLSDTSILKLKFTLFKLKKLIINDIVKTIINISKKLENTKIEKLDALYSISNLIDLIIKISENTKKYELGLKLFKNTITDIIECYSLIIKGLHSITEIKFDSKKISDFIVDSKTLFNKLLDNLTLFTIKSLAISTLIILSTPTVLIGILLLYVIFNSFNKLFIVINKLSVSYENVDKVINDVGNLFIKFGLLAAGLVLISKILPNKSDLAITFGIFSGLIVSSIGLILLLSKLEKYITISNQLNKTINTIGGLFLKLGLLTGAIILISKYIPTNIVNLITPILTLGTIIISIIGTVKLINSFLSETKIDNDALNKINRIALLFGALTLLTLGIGYASQFLTIESLSGIFIIVIALGSLKGIISIVNNIKINNNEIQSINLLIESVSKLIGLTLLTALISKLITYEDIQKSSIIFVQSLLILLSAQYIANKIKNNATNKLKLLVSYTENLVILVAGIIFVSKLITYEDILKATFIFSASLLILLSVQYIANKIKDNAANKLKSLVLYTGALLILITGITLISKIITFEDIIKSGLIILGSLLLLASTMALLTFFNEKHLSKVKGVLLLTVGLMLIPIGLMLISKYVDINSLLIGSGILVISLGILFLSVKALNLIKPGENIKNILMATTCVLLLSIIPLLITYVGQVATLTDIILGGLIMFLTIGLILGVMKILTLNAVQKILLKGSVSLVLLSLVIWATTKILVDAIVGIISLSKYNLSEILIGGAIIIGTIVIFLGIIALIAAAMMVVSPVVILAAAATLLLVPIILWLLAEAIKNLISIIDIITGVEINSDTFFNALKLLGLGIILGIGFSLLGLAAPFILLGIGSIYLLDFGITKMIEVINKISNVDISVGLENVNDVLWGFGKIALKFIALTPVLLMAMPAALSSLVLSFAISNLADAIGKFAIMQFPTKFDKDGKVIESITLNESDIKKAADNVKLVLTTLLDAISDVQKNNPDLFKENLFKGARSPFTVFMSSSVKLGKMVSSLAEGIQSFANLTYPIYDNNGQLVGRKNLGEGEFKVAQDNIKTILTTVIDVIKDLASSNYGEFFKEGFFEKSPYTVFMNSSHKLGNMVANLAEGVQAFANLTYPIYDENGKESGRKNLGTAEMATASSNIQTILTTVIDAIKSLASSEYGDMFEDGFFKKSKYSVFMNSSEKLGAMVSGLAQGVQAFANLTYPTKWNEEGKPIEFKALGETEFETAQSNIGKILTTVFNSIAQIASNPEYAKLFESGWLESSPTKAFFENADKLGTMVKNLAEGIQGFAMLQIPGGFGKDKNETEILKIQQSIFDQANTNIGKILTTLFTAIQKAASDPAVKEILKGGIFGGDSDFGKLTEGTSKIASGLAAIANNLVIFSTKKIPTKVDNDGKVVDSVELNTDNVQETITNILTAILKGSSDAINQNKDIVDDIDDVIKTVTSISTLSNTLSKSITTITNVLKSINDVQITTYDKSPIKTIIDVTKALINDVATFSEPNTEIFSIFNGGVDKIKELVESAKTFGELNSSTMESNKNSISSYVKSVNTLDIKKTDKLITLSRELNKLGQNINNVQKVFDSFTTKLMFIVDKLIKNLTIVEKSINKSDEIQEKRREIIKSTINEIKSIMDQKLEVEIKNDTSDTTTSTSSVEGSTNTNNNNNVKNTNQNNQTQTNNLNHIPSSNKQKINNYNMNNNDNEYERLVDLLENMLKGITLKISND